MYEPLDRAWRGIRLIRVIGGSKDGPVSCSHETASLDHDKPDFAALSYVCGDESTTKEIIVGGVLRTVTTNLEAALRNFWNYSAQDTEGTEDDDALDDDVARHFRGRRGENPPLEDVQRELHNARVLSTTLRTRIGRGMLPIWVDSLCSNQVDLDERSHQIRFMQHI